MRNKFNLIIFKLEIIASYSDDDIYLYETSQDSEKDAKFRYRGHRNSETSKLNSL